MEVVLISRLEEKFQLLLKKMQYLQEENERLRLTVARQQTESGEQATKIRELENNMALQKIAGAAGSDGHDDSERRKQLRSTINKYIREIDHCIAQLNE